MPVGGCGLRLYQSARLQRNTVRVKLRGIPQTLLGSSEPEKSPEKTLSADTSPAWPADGKYEYHY